MLKARGTKLVLLVLLLGLLFTEPSYAATITVNSTADNLTAGNGLCTLREAIMNANLPAGGDSTSGDCVAGVAGTDTIVFDSSLNGTPIVLGLAGSGEDANATGDLDLTDAITIQGQGARNTIIDGGGIDRVFHITGNGTYLINDLTIRNGSTLGTGGHQGGGGLFTHFFFSGSLTLNNLTISGNRAGEFGGGVYGNGTTNVNGSTFVNNSALGSGGAMYSDAGTVTITNSTISGNQANGFNGGVRLWANGTIINSTIVLNTADADNNGSGDGGGVGGNVVLQNTILALNTDRGGQAPNCSNTTTSNNYNLFEDLTGCTLTPLANDILNTNPNLIILQDNGGGTNTHGPLTGSVVIDYIPNGTNGCGTTITSDQRGIARPQNGNCEIGSYEGELPTALTLRSFNAYVDDIETMGLLLVLLFLGAVSSGLIWRSRYLMRGE